MSTDPNDIPSPLDTEKLTWAALLAHWTDFARSAVALPDDAEGRAWKTAIPPIIGLQAVTMALTRGIDELPPDELALGLDRARLLVERHTDELHAAFAGQLTESDNRLHPMLEELILDAWTAIHQGEKQLAHETPS